MRLINVDTFKLERRTDEKDGYAILSHTWLHDAEGEISLQEFQRDLTDKALNSRKGFLKVEMACVKAAEHGLKYLWADTCCIDQTNSAELSRSINSMFRWYRESNECLVYLSDVSLEVGRQWGSDDWKQQFRSSRWFRRGWTLQELIAPMNVVFYDEDWNSLGTREDLKDLISEITHIPEALLNGRMELLSEICVAQKMSWASMRMTSEPEDMAYCLMGLFDVNLPLMYGEGAHKAFLRLQEAIIKQTDDNSIFAWCISEEEAKTQQFSGLLASSPRSFSSSTAITASLFRFSADSPRLTISQGGLDLSLYVEPCNSHGLHGALLDCFFWSENLLQSRVKIFVQQISTSRFCRVHLDKMERASFYARGGWTRQFFVKHVFTWPKPPVAFQMIMSPISSAFINDLEVKTVSVHPEREFQGTPPDHPLYSLMNRQDMPAMPSELMADLSTIRRIVYGSITLAIEIKPTKKPPPFLWSFSVGTENPAAPTQPAQPAQPVDEVEIAVPTHKVDVLFGYEVLAAKDDATRTRRLFPWATITEHTPPPPPAPDAGSDFDYDFEAQLTEWRQKIEKLIEEKCKWDYPVPLSIYGDLKQNELETVWVVDKMSISMDDEMVGGIAIHTIRLRNEVSKLRAIE